MFSRNVSEWGVGLGWAGRGEGGVMGAWWDVIVDDETTTFWPSRHTDIQTIANQSFSFHPAGIHCIYQIRFSFNFIFPTCSIYCNTLSYQDSTIIYSFYNKTWQINSSHLMTKPRNWHVRPAKTQHPPSLIRVFAVRLMGSLGPKLSSCGQRRLIRLGGCPDWSESSLGAHATLLVLTGGGSLV